MENVVAAAEESVKRASGSHAHTVIVAPVVRIRFFSIAGTSERRRTLSVVNALIIPTRKQTPKIERKNSRVATSSPVLRTRIPSPPRQLFGFFSKFESREPFPLYRQSIKPKIETKTTHHGQSSWYRTPAAVGGTFSWRAFPHSSRARHKTTTGRPPPKTIVRA